MKNRIIFSCHTIAIALTFSVLFGTSPSHAQVIIEDELHESGSTGKLFGKLSVSAAEGSSHRASYQELEIGYDTLFNGERGRFYFSGTASNTSLELDLELEDLAPGETRPADLERKRTRKEDESDYDVSDAFVQYDLPGNLAFTLGRRRVAWGQFDLFSPVNLALPLSLQTAEPTPRKVNTLVPQDQVAISWFPTERMEVQAYYFFGTQIDYLIEDVVEGDTKEDFYKGDSLNEDDRIELSVDQNDLTDHDQYAARILFYRDWGTLGITYHRGRDALSVDSDLATIEETGGTGSGFEAFNVRRHPDLPASKNYGLELAVPYGKWVWKLEVLHQETTTDLEGYSTQYGNNTTDNPLFLYLDSVVEDNAGKLYVPVDRTIVGFGADSDRTNWRFNLGLFVLSESYDEEANDLIQLEMDAGFDEDRDETYVLPAINIARYFGGDKQEELGFAGGFLGAYAGATLYFTSHVGDNFRWVAAVEAFSSLRDQLVSDTGPDSDRYDLADDFSAGGRVGLIYSF